ncbi:nuclear transport factor 2 family protein [Candidatus Uabimicrobium amorphum]|uniref:SnoaL-like domain-containing protein n=1 Tax=Uabimicrobium amorphum TaxID=2596890 RepID=A0A5S9F6E3_UABAM|nr:nuclear transport factor 2 family protein [Candidatus Uabimicrobium amorphum]BBM87608.1 hypothetical protein UABAM_06020 [Candidatus Uabimicrobium amorphum]
MKYLYCFLIFSVAAYAQSDEMKKMYDEWQIIKVVNAIDTTVDEKKWEECRSYFLDTIKVDFSSLVGGKPMTLAADVLIGAWKRALYSDKKSLHMRTNHRVTIKGDNAEVFSHGYALNILPMKNGSDLWEVWGTYVHKLKRTKDGWKVSYMQFTVTYARGNEKVREFVPATKPQEKEQPKKKE